MTARPLAFSCSTLCFFPSLSRRLRGQQPAAAIAADGLACPPLVGGSFKRSAAEKILKEVLEEKMAFTNERDKKGRLSFVYNSDDSGETIREIVEDCQKKVVGARRLRLD